MLFRGQRRSLRLRFGYGDIVHDDRWRGDGSVVSHVKSQMDDDRDSSITVISVISPMLPW